MSEFKELEGKITFIETDEVRNSISIGENDSLIDVWNFGLTKEAHTELTTTITKALKIRQEINFDLVELLRQRNEMFETLKIISSAGDDIWNVDDKNILFQKINFEEIQELIKQATEI